MEILILAVIISGSFPFLKAVLGDGQIVKRVVKVAKAHLNRHKKIVPGIVTADMRALSPRQKDWGPDGKLTLMWQDAFDYWQIENPQEVMASYRKKAAKIEELRETLEQTVKLGEDLYNSYINSRGHVSVHTAVDARSKATDARRRLSLIDTEYLKNMTPDERVMGRLVERYGSEVYYNNDMVRLSAQKKMPTFDYIALTSV